MRVINEGTLGSEPSQVSLNKILIELNDRHVTNIVMSKYQKAKIHLKKLNRYIRDHDIEFYDQMLALLREKWMAACDSVENDMPEACFTHFRCCMVGLFRQAKREIEADIKENIRRVQKGQQPI